MNPTRIANRMSGENAELSRIAPALALRYFSLSRAILAVSAFSAVKLFMVAMPPRLLASAEFTAAAWLRTAA